ncbi:MAG: family 10 glycosylhydrolase, partial [Clostridiaceae bacterium]|nr:family 10 glycosylhydrolase [Clostridiaceae bacterium]
MKYFKSTLLCICLFTIFLTQINVNAEDNIKITTPSIVFEDSTTYSIDLINKEREEGKIILYTRNYGEFTKPFAANTHEFVVVNNIVVHENTSGVKGTYIPPNGYVISYTDNDTDFIKKFNIGASLTFSNMDIPISPDMYFVLGDMLIPIDQINIGRDANKVVLYNPSYGTSTKTNVWGIELIVVNNVITRIADITNDNGTQGENNSQIPSDGVVISIHIGSPYYKQVHEKAKQGDNVKVSADAKLFNASKIKYAAYNPRTIADNPTAWDMEEGKPYDSFRGPNQLIIYDSSYDERTGTNPYGYEVTVNSAGKIISTGGNDSKIPSGGYILSGHGESLKWLQKYALLGATVVTSSAKKEVTVILTPDSYINRALFSIKSAQDSLDLAKLKYLDISYDNVQKEIHIAESKLMDLQVQLKKVQYEGLIDAVKEIQKDADNAYFMTFESLKVENRAVWLRPRDTSIDEIKKRLDMLESININTIYLETYWNGYAIYPTGDELMQHNPMFKGFDVLDAYIREAHSRGIELHAWVENFLVDMPIAEKKPEWMSMSRKGDAYYLENGVTKYYFMNPALPEVRGFLSGLYKELVRSYQIDGIQFDYMRYPNSGDYTNDFGYDKYTRQLFINYTGTDPIALKPGNSLWQKWCEFRAHIVSSYAYRIISEVKSVKPEIHISADVWPDYDETLVDIYQNPKAWTNQDYMNTLIPMSYYLHEAPVVDDIMNTWTFARGHSQVASGIATFTKVDTKVLLRQIDAIRTANTNGIAIFEFESIFNGDYDGALRSGVFGTPSAVTNRDPEQSIKTVLNDISRKIRDIYQKYNGMDNEQAKKYNKLIEGINFSFKDGKAKEAYSLNNNIQEILKTVNSDASLNKEIAKRISFDLNSVMNIVYSYISDTRFMTDHIVREFQVELPFKALKDNKSAAFKVKAIFNDDAVMYLDQVQYSISSSNPDSTEISGGILNLKDEKAEARITVDILNSFKFNTGKGVNKKIEFATSQ